MDFLGYLMTLIQLLTFYIVKFRSIANGELGKVWYEGYTLYIYSFYTSEVSNL